jgi:hypothetical protein
MMVNPCDTGIGGEGPGTGRWLRCNFHTHAGTGPGTCGSNGLSEVVEAYRQGKYDILCISNHDLFTRTEQLSSGMKLIHGVEYSTHPHMLTIGVEEHWGKGHQETIDLAKAAGGYVILCHPNWMRKGYWSREMLAATRGYGGIEIFNTVIYRLDGSGYACDTWDWLLSRGKLAFGFGNDDFHIWYDLGRSWTMVNAASDSWPELREAMEAGRMYVSTGLRLRSLELRDGVLGVEAGYFTETWADSFRYRFIGREGAELAAMEGRSAEYRLSGDESYVRVEVTSEEGFRLYTQPVYEDSLFSAP